MKKSENIIKKAAISKVHQVGKEHKEKLTPKVFGAQAKPGISLVSDIYRMGSIRPPAEKTARYLLNGLHPVFGRKKCLLLLLEYSIIKVIYCRPAHSTWNPFCSNYRKDNYCCRKVDIASNKLLCNNIYNICEEKI